jgi:Xaa-Pro aminopeptidase
VEAIRFLFGFAPMFQTFDTVSDPSLAPPRVKAVRALLEKAGLVAFVVPRSDEYLGEYVPASAERLKWLTGFSGSAGLAIIGLKAAALSTDGRYTIQAQAQLDAGTFEIIDSTEKPWIEWLTVKVPAGGAIGYDPRLHSAAFVSALKVEAQRHAFTLKPVSQNPVDEAWGADRPRAPRGKIAIQPLELAGTSAETKIADLQRALAADKQTAVVLTMSDSIAWLFNIRGSDIPHNPVPLCIAIVPAKGKPELIIDAAKLTIETKKYLTGFCKLVLPTDISVRLRGLAQRSENKVRVDPATASQWIVGALGSCAEHGGDPCTLPKARKNAAELEGARVAHVRDGAVMARFLAWLDEAAAGGQLDEIGVVEKLEALRRATNVLKDISFTTIAGSGPNGALPHYRVSRESNRVLKSGEIIVIDSGGQYQDGTTDITRTVAIGAPSAEMRLRFTQVLKGHIAIATARFPAGTRGVQLDTLARQTLWQAGCDFDHGTGHGVGSFLSVHEGPQSISKRGMAPLEPGMIVSNEPGFYKVGAYGIRIENLEVVTEPGTITGGERPMLGFRSITLAPIDLRLVDIALLSAAERAWLNTYHKRVRETLSPELDPATQKWLTAATKAV